LIVGEKMNKSLSTFMVMAVVVTIMITLVLGVVYKSLEEKNQQHELMLRTQHQLKMK
jgi:cell division protein FtsN